jgi:hypothetical protein
VLHIPHSIECENYDEYVLELFKTDAAISLIYDKPRTYIDVERLIGEDGFDTLEKLREYHEWHYKLAEVCNQDHTILIDCHTYDPDRVKGVTPDINIGTNKDPTWFNQNCLNILSRVKLDGLINHPFTGSIIPHLTKKHFHSIMLEINRKTASDAIWRKEFNDKFKEFISIISRDPNAFDLYYSILSGDNNIGVTHDKCCPQ